MGCVDARDIPPGPPPPSGRLHHPQDAQDIPQIQAPASECQGQMRIIAFLTDDSVVDRIINHLKLTFVADKAPQPQIAFQECLVTAEPGGEYLS